jgi:glycosyltransferase involved in cell wall biosynthesis
MKILMIAPQPFLEPRGTPISVYQRLQGLSMIGHQVDLITYPIGKDVDLPGVRIHRTISLPMIRTVRIGPSWTKLILDIFLFFKAFWMLLSRRYDVIHTHEEGAFLALILAPIFHIPHLYDMHSSLPNQLKNFRFGNSRLVINIFEILENWILKTCKMVLTVGIDLEEYVLNKNPNANHIRIENLPIFSYNLYDDGVVNDLKSRLDLHNKFPIVYTGSFEDYQGLDLLFKSANLISEEHPEVSFVMVGGKPDQIRYWKEETSRLGLKNNFIFVGTVPMEDSLNYLKMAEILVSPRMEGVSIPLKIYTYLHSGKPIVAVKIKGHTQILNEEISILVDSIPEAFAEGIFKLIENPDLRKQIGHKAQLFAREEFTIERYILKLNKAYLAIKYSMHIDEITADHDVNQETLNINGRFGDLSR